MLTYFILGYLAIAFAQWFVVLSFSVAYVMKHKEVKFAKGFSLAALEIALKAAIWPVFWVARLLQRFV